MQDHGEGREPSGARSDSDATEGFLFHLRRGGDLLRDSRVAEAKEELERALKLKPDDPKGQDLLAVVYFRLGLYPRAIGIYQSLLQTFPGDPALVLNLALCLLKTGQPEHARTLLEPLVQDQPGHARAWGYLGLVYERMGEYEKARHAFEKSGRGSMARRMDDLVAARGSRARAEGPLGPRDATGLAESGPLSTTGTARRHDGAISISYSAPPDESSPVDPDMVATFVPPSGPSSSPLPPPGVESTLRPTCDSSTPAGSPRAASAEAAPSGPSAEAAPSGPSAEAAPSGPSAEAAPSGPSAEAAPSGPSAEAAPSGPSATPELARQASSGPVVGASAPARAIPTPFVPYWSAAPIPTDLWAGLAPNAAETARQVRLEFPPTPGCAPHEGGIVLVRIDGTFATRLNALRLVRPDGPGARTSPLVRRGRGRVLDETMGTAEDPFVLLSGRADLAFAPRPGRALRCMGLADELLYLREEAIIGFDGLLSYENGRIARESDVSLPVVQLRGTGIVVFEVPGSLATVDLGPERSIVLGLDALVGWTGRLLPHDAASDPSAVGPAGRAIALSGEGTLWLSTAAFGREER